MYKNDIILKIHPKQRELYKERAKHWRQIKTENMKKKQTNKGNIIYKLIVPTEKLQF